MAPTYQKKAALRLAFWRAGRVMQGARTRLDHSMSADRFSERDDAVDDGFRLENELT
jgi:hypothetical protein